MKNQETIVHWHIFDDAIAVAAEAEKRILDAASQSIADRGLFRLVLAGGSTPEAVYRLLTTADTDWSKWEIYFGDERCLPINDPDRNSVMAEEAFLNQIGIPSVNIHPIPSEKGAEIAAKEYESIVKEALPFDVVLLGIGEDGHTASLFPGQEHPSGLLVCPVHNAPKPPTDRVSLCVDALNSAETIMVLATGAGKRDAIRAWQEGEALPIAKIGGSTAVTVLMDEAAQPS